MPSKTPKHKITEAERRKGHEARRFKSEHHDLSDYYLDILEKAIRPMAVSAADPGVSLTAIVVLSYWRYLQPIPNMTVRKYQLYETSPSGITALQRHGRNTSF